MSGASAELSDIVALPAAMTIESVEALAEAWRTGSFSAPVVTLDASAVELITTPGVQLVVSLAKTLEQQGKALHITGARPVVSQTFEQLGLAAHYLQWETTHG